MKEHTIGVITQLTDTGFTQEIRENPLPDFRHGIFQRVVNVAAVQADEAFRKKLIELGWTPPPDFRCPHPGCGTPDQPGPCAYKECPRK